MLSSVQDRILGAAVQVVGEVGAGHLTLDRVALEAGVSKGGLLYHYRNKQVLIEAMIERVLDEFQRKIKEKTERYTNSKNKTLRAAVDITIELTVAEKSQQRALLAAAAENPEFLVPVRKVIQDHFDAVDSESDNSDETLLILLALEGIRFMEIFDLMPVGENRLRELFSKIDFSEKIKKI